MSARHAVISLRALNCQAWGKREPLRPYLWPALVVIDDSTIKTRGLVRVITPGLAAARVVLSQGMHIGEAAAIPDNMAQLEARIVDTGPVQSAILIVAAMNARETPYSAVEAGYGVFADALRAGIARRLLQLRMAAAEPDAPALDSALSGIVADIAAETETKVSHAIRDQLSPRDQIRVREGDLPADQVIGMDWLMADPVTPRDFWLNLASAEAEAPPVVLQLEGRLHVTAAHRDRPAKTEPVRSDGVIRLLGRWRSRSVLQPSGSEAARVIRPKFR